LEDHVLILKQKGMKVTPQRLEIMRYLDKNRIHPSIDHIFTQLKKKNPSLSKTTVYNAIDDLSENGVIQVLTINRSEILCDFNSDPHYHFMCKECGAVTDLDESYNADLIDKIRTEGYRVDEAFGFFRGICRSCLNKNREGEIK
jgi:Fur family transcriptional regulator, peroxide stress response regulator